MSSRTGKKNACSAPHKTQNRPYDNRPGSGNAKQRMRKTDAIRVDLPDELTLTPEAAWALLRILLKARDRLDSTGNPQGAAK